MTYLGQWLMNELIEICLSSLRLGSIAAPSHQVLEERKECSAVKLVLYLIVAT